MNYTKIVYRIRQRIFDYPPDKEEKAGRVLEKAVKRKIQQQGPPPQIGQNYYM